jgi:hypothetical protein
MVLVKLVLNVSPKGDIFPAKEISTGIESLKSILGISHFNESIKTLRSNLWVDSIDLFS